MSFGLIFFTIGIESMMICLLLVPSVSDTNNTSDNPKERKITDVINFPTYNKFTHSTVGENIELE